MSDATWQRSALSALAVLVPDDVPALEVLLLDALASWVTSPANPGRRYTDDHGGVVVRALLAAVRRAPSYRPCRIPPVTPNVAALRQQVVHGAHEIAAAEVGGLSYLSGGLRPAAVGELTRHVGDRVGQIYGLFGCSMASLSSGTSGVSGDDETRALLDVVNGVVTGWDSLMADGFRMPSQLAAAS